MYIGFAGSHAAKAVVLELLWNAMDESRNPRSPLDQINIVYDERIDQIEITDNGRGIPTDKLEMLFTTLNSGSNIDPGSKVDLRIGTLGRNGVGTLAVTGLGAKTEVISYRGGTENKFKHLLFREGIKIEEEEGTCLASKHGLTVYYSPSKILGRGTRIIWKDIAEILISLQFLSSDNIKITSTYIDKEGNFHEQKYKTQPLEAILPFKNNKDALISEIVKLTLKDDNVSEEVGGKKYTRFIEMSVVLAFTNNYTNPYIDSFSNLNCTSDGGSHVDGTFEAICRYFQLAAKNSMNEKEKDKLDIKWDDVRAGLSVVVSLVTNLEEIFTGQTKQKISNVNLEKLIKDSVGESLQEWGVRNPSHLKELLGIVKMNAKARREGEKVKSAIMKESVSNNWKAFLMRNYDPCTNRGKEYKELYICEGISARGSLRQARDPKTQALFAIRGVSANVFKLDLNGILANAEFRDLIKVMGCNVGASFDLSKLFFNKIIIATDADKVQCQL